MSQGPGLCQLEEIPEGSARGVSVEDFVETEITARSRVTPAEARAFYMANRARFERIGEAEAIQKIVEGLGV